MAEPEDQELRVYVNTRCWLVDGRENRLKKKKTAISTVAVFIGLASFISPSLSYHQS